MHQSNLSASNNEAHKHYTPAEEPEEEVIPEARQEEEEDVNKNRENVEENDGREHIYRDRDEEEVNNLPVETSKK